MVRRAHDRLLADLPAESGNTSGRVGISPSTVSRPGRGDTIEHPEAALLVSLFDNFEDHSSQFGFSSQFAMRIKPAAKCVAGLLVLSSPLSSIPRTGLVDALLAIYHATGSKGLRWEEASTQQEAQIRDKNIAIGLNKFSNKALKAHLAAWRRRQR